MLAVWTAIWWWWLLGIAASFAVLEGTAVLLAWRAKQPNDAVWTLSDTIRRWAVAWRPLAAVVSGVVLGLLVHWFVTSNPT